MTETKAQRADRLLAQSRLIVEVAGDPARPGLVVARCRGDSGQEHRLGFDPRRREWRCTCEASSKFHRGCAHLEALKRVVAV